MKTAIRSSLRVVFKQWQNVAFLILACVNAVPIGAQGVPATEPLRALASSAEFDDWLIQCGPFTESISNDIQRSTDPLAPECQMSQRISFADSNDTLLSVNLYLNPIANKPEVVFILPLGIPLGVPIVLSVNNSEVLSLRVSHCHSDGCYFKAPLSNRLTETFLKMYSGDLQLSGEGGETITIPISGSGSRAAYNYFLALQ